MWVNDACELAKQRKALEKMVRDVAKIITVEGCEEMFLITIRELVELFFKS